MAILYDVVCIGNTNVYGEWRTVNSADTQRDSATVAGASLEPIQTLQENANSNDSKHESAVKLTMLRNSDIFDADCERNVSRIQRAARPRLDEVTIMISRRSCQHSLTLIGVAMGCTGCTGRRKIWGPNLQRKVVSAPPGRVCTPGRANVQEIGDIWTMRGVNFVVLASV